MHLIAQQLSSVASKNSARPAIRYLGKDMSYNELRIAIARLSYLYLNDIKGKARVAFYTRNSTAVISTFFALTNIRAVIIPINPDLPPDEIAQWITEAQATHIAVTSDLLAHAKDLLRSAHLNLPIIEIEKKIGGEYDTSFTPPPENQPLETDVILLLRTGGVTGKAKYAAFTHKQLGHAAACLKGLYHLTSNDRILTTMNWFHPFSFVHGMLLPLMSGATCVIDHGLDTAEFLKFLTESRVTRLIGTPSFFLKLLSTCKNEKVTLPGIKSVTVGMGILPAQMMKVFELMKIAVAHTYGQTENLWTIALQDTEPSKSEAEGDAIFYDEPTTCRALPGLKYKVVDANGDEIPGPESRTGLLAVTSPTMMSGYPGHDKETKSAIRGTWLYTGDIVRLDGANETLRLTFIGRKPDLITVDGELIAMDEINQTLRKIPGALDGAAFVTKTSRNEPVIACAIVKAPATNLGEKHVLDYCKNHLYTTYVPRVVVFTDFIPRDIGGNPNYTKLRNQFSGVAG